MNTAWLRRRVVALVSVLAIGVPASGGVGFQWLGEASDAENDAIRYSRTVPSDAVARLQDRIDAGAAHLEFEPSHGYLRSILTALQIPASSQALVFSKTSFQRELISPANPRALYFNRDVHVGWVPGGRVLEIAAADPMLGAVFYTLPQERAAHPRFERQTRKCLPCHDSASETSGVPGLIMRSVHADRTGEPSYVSGTFVTTDQSPLSERWGGWFVTGNPGAPAHMGNRAAGDRVDVPAAIGRRGYLSDGSDIVALMVLEHQARIHNLITRANYRTRMALAFDDIQNQALDRRRDYVPDSTAAVIRRVTEPLVEAMLFVDEAPLEGSIAGTSGFSRNFGVNSPKDRKGRSLRDLDLARRLFRYPCSYLIYSPSFDALPAPAKHEVYRRLSSVLNGSDTSRPFAHLSRNDRRAILEILTETKPDFVAWQQKQTAS